MGKAYVELSYFQVSLAAFLIVINGAISNQFEGALLATK